MRLRRLACCSTSYQVRTGLCFHSFTVPIEYPALHGKEELEEIAKKLVEGVSHVLDYLGAVAELHPIAGVRVLSSSRYSTIAYYPKDRGRRSYGKLIDLKHFSRSGTDTAIFAESR